MTKFLIASDLHYGVNSSLEDFPEIKEDYDCALLAGDNAVEVLEHKEVFEKYFSNHKICFVGGNHIVYRDRNKNRFVEDINSELRENFPLDSDIAFMENDYKIINDVVIIACNLYTDYKIKEPKLYKSKCYIDKLGRTVFQDKKGNDLPLPPTESDWFKEKHKELSQKYFESGLIDLDNKVEAQKFYEEFKVLVDSVQPKFNETVLDFKNRVPKENFDYWKSYFEGQNRVARIPYTVKDYENYHKRIGMRNLSDFRLGSSYENFNNDNLLGMLTPDLYQKWHRQSLRYIQKIYNQFKNTDYKIIVMTHHCPTYKLQDDMYRDSDLNGSFFSDLDSFIKKNDKIAYWICGHIHTRKQTVVGNTVVIANPYGYSWKYEPVGFSPIFIEL